MFGNFINRHDFAELLRLRRVVSKLTHRLTLGRDARVVEVWSARATIPALWTDLDAVNRRINRMISGDGDTQYWDFVDRKYFSASSGLVGLSLGCGAGTREINWAGLGRFSRIDAYDVSPSQIEVATKTAAERGHGGVLNFKVGSVYDLLIPEGSYDVVFVEHALHHFTPLREVLARIERVLKPNGLFIVNEFVGPTRFQWTERQLEVINAALTLLPKKFRRTIGGAESKARNTRPSILRMLMSDPSEAVESARIRPLLQELFDVVEVRDYGGTALSLILSAIAQNFGDDDESVRALSMLFDAEDLLLASGELTSDFALIVCRRRPTAAA
jgi:ubiquinone/menaquinone biosynthesis C-methylase UbiE